MTSRTNGTHDGSLRSWVDSANDGTTDFPIQNLPFGVFDDGRGARVGVAIGNRVLDLSRAAETLHGMEDVVEASRSASLNALFVLPRARLHALRAELSRVLASDADARTKGQLQPALLAADDVTMRVPAEIGDYTDFYASIDHATNVGSMFRPENPLLPNYKYVPIGYHGRASSIVASGTAIRRPQGQTRAEGQAPVFGPSQRLDYECEIGAFVRKGNPLGEPIPVGRAEEHLFGLCLVNDWSARDVQTWEYQPLGPFLAKNFATTVSPWVVTLEALAPFRTAAYRRPAGDPAPLPYLSDDTNRAAGGFDVITEVYLRTAAMRERGLPAQRVSSAPFTAMYWTFAQMLAHHASNGCNLRPGDLIASGTVSGAAPDARGCLLELAWRGTRPLTLPTGEQRAFLEDGDEVELRAWCARDGYARIGFGTCVGRVLPGT